MIAKSFITKVTFDNLFQYIKNNSSNQTNKNKSNNNKNIKLYEISDYVSYFYLKHNKILTLIYHEKDSTYFYEYLLQMPYSIGYFK